MVAAEVVMSLARQHLGCAHPRAFGADVRDLEVDFDAARAHVAVRLVARCLGCEESAVRALTVQARTLLLLGVSELSIPEPVEAHLPCACGEVAVVELATQDLVQFVAERSRPALVVRAGETAVTMRLPTGDDQARWAALASPREAAVLADLVTDGELSDELASLADALLGEVDPLVELEVESVCPRCGAALSRPVDVERVALTRLRNARRMLLEQVHAIAATYHWTESVIAALPAWRRAEYAALARSG